MSNFEIKVLKTLKLCKEELNNRKNGISGESTVEQLENIIIPELEKILIDIDNNKLPPKEQRYLLSFANAFVVWGWSMQQATEIYVLLAELNNEYKEF